MKSLIVLLFFLIPLVWTKSVNANYLTTKTFLLYLSTSLALFTLPDQLDYRRVPKSLLLVLGAIFTYYVAYTFFDFEWSNIYHLYKMLAFVFIVLFVYSLNLKIENLFAKSSLVFAAMWFLIAGFTGYEIFDLRVLNSNIKTDIILSTFGNINMFSEFAILSVPLLFLWGRYPDKIPRWLKLSLISAVFFFILYGRSRSALMGLLLWLAFKAYQGIKKDEWVALTAALLLFLLSHFTAPNAEEISKFVPTAFSERAGLYKGSLELLWDKPTGIQLGQFMNEIVPYLIGRGGGPNEFAYFDQPHSEFLKWGIQFGWLMLALVFACIGILIKEILRKYKNPEAPETRETNAIFAEAFLVFIPQALFQFPFENPSSILIVAVYFGLFLSSYKSEGRKLSLQYAKYLLGALALSGILNSFLFFSAIYLESQYSMSPDIMNVVCRIYPADFRACYWKNKNLLGQKNITAFKAEFAKDYVENPFFCDNLRLLPEYFNYNQNAKKTCEALILYKYIYKNQRHFLPESFNQCASVSMPIAESTGREFNEAFRRWFAAP